DRGAEDHALRDLRARPRSRRAPEVPAADGRGLRGRLARPEVDRRGFPELSGGWGLGAGRWSVPNPESPVPSSPQLPAPSPQSLFRKIGRGAVRRAISLNPARSNVVAKPVLEALGVSAASSGYASSAGAFFRFA